MQTPIKAIISPSTSKSHKKEDKMAKTCPTYCLRDVCFYSPKLMVIRSQVNLLKYYDSLKLSKRSLI